jgi:hypothetical protein
VIDAKDAKDQKSEILIYLIFLREVHTISRSSKIRIGTRRLGVESLTPEIVGLSADFLRECQCRPSSIESLIIAVAVKISYPLPYSFNAMTAEAETEEAGAGGVVPPNKEAADVVSEEEEEDDSEEEEFDDDDDDDDDSENVASGSGADEEDEEEGSDDEESILTTSDDGYIDHYDESTLPPYACRYCGIHDPASVAKCCESNKWFCNATCTGGGGSHLVHHLVRSRSNQVQLHPESPLGDTVLECYNCASKNSFVLGFVPATSSSVVVLLCRVCVETVPALKDMDWELSQWHPLVQDRKFLPWLVKVSWSSSHLIYSCHWGGERTSSSSSMFMCFYYIITIFCNILNQLFIIFTLLPLRYHRTSFKFVHATSPKIKSTN